MAKIDIVIGTHNRSKELVDTLKAFNDIKKANEKENKKLKFEVIVIDSSDKKLEKKYQKICSIYIHNKETKPLSVKRNLGIKLSKAEFVAFTDDDCIPKEDWISEILNTFEKYNCVCVTGKTVPHEGYEISKYEKKFGFGRVGEQERIFHKILGLFNISRVGHGNNMAFRRKIFEKIGLFDVNLGVGSKGLAGEDRDMFYRTYKKDYRIVYNPLAIIYHKHLIKDEEIPKIAYRNSFSYKKFLLKHKDLNCISLYLLGFSKFFLRFVFYSVFYNKIEKNLNLQKVKGWLGIKNED